MTRGPGAVAMVVATALILGPAVLAGVRGAAPVAELPGGADGAARLAQTLAAEARPGGAAMARRPGGPRGFDQPASGMNADDAMQFALGGALFRKLWVAAPSSTRASDGLGPLFNARSCESCHTGGGRGHPVAPDGTVAPALVLHLSVPGGDGTPGPEPVYGRQIQTRSTPGLAVEARVEVIYENFEIAVNGAPPVAMRRPVYAVKDPGYGPMAPGAMLSPRLAPQMIGLGLLEAVPAADILAGADPEDADGDGISGRANMVRSGAGAVPVLGRFGWKAGMATVRDQSAAAFANDLGLSTPVLAQPWGDCTRAQVACRQAPHGDGDARGTEVDAAALAAVVFHAANMAVPGRRNADDPEVRHGRALFRQIGCSGCHRPGFVTALAPERPAQAGQAGQAGQAIWPFSDLLLHDMGEGLADHRPEALADGREWRTPPLWGVGLTGAVSGPATFLHDGRARSLVEAVLWHGGEAEAQRNAVIGLSVRDRAALIRFLESL